MQKTKIELIKWLSRSASAILQYFLQPIFSLLAVKIGLTLYFISKFDLKDSLLTLNQGKSTLFASIHAKNHKIGSFKLNFWHAPNFWLNF